MATNVIMPQLGESVVEGTISRWLVTEGDTVSKYDVLMEVSTDKVDTEVPAPAGGTVLKIYFPEGETLRAGTVIAIIGQPGEAVPTEPAFVDTHELAGTEGQKRGPEPAETPAPEPEREPASGALAEETPAPDRPSGPRGRISPVVARIAQEHGVDLNQIEGTGREGRITKKDILAYVAARDKDEATPGATPAEEELAPWERPGTGDLFKPTDDLPLTATEARAPRPSEALPARKTAPEQVAEEFRPQSRRRKLIAEHMVLSKRTSPHVTTVMEADMSAIVAHRMRQRMNFAAQGVTLTFTAYFIQAVIAGLKAVPEANAVYQEDGLLLKRTYHIGMATAVPEGLIVPVIHNADDLSLLGLARKVNDLAQRARAGKLQPDEIQGATFTVTNHGTSGSLLAAPIINQPNVGILGVGAIQKRPVVISLGHRIEPSADDFIAIRPMVYLSFTFDHRVLDGAGADGFLLAVKQALEGWA